MQGRCICPIVVIVGKGRSVVCRMPTTKLRTHNKNGRSPTLHLEITSCRTHRRHRPLLLLRCLATTRRYRSRTTNPFLALRRWVFRRDRLPPEWSCPPPNGSSCSTWPSKSFLIPPSPAYLTIHLPKAERVDSVGQTTGRTPTTTNNTSTTTGEPSQPLRVEETVASCRPQSRRIVMLRLQQQQQGNTTNIIMNPNRGTID